MPCLVSSRFYHKLRAVCSLSTQTIIDWIHKLSNVLLTINEDGWLQLHQSDILLWDLQSFQTVLNYHVCAWEYYVMH